MRRVFILYYFISVVFGLGFFGFAEAAPALSNVRAENIIYPGAQISWDTNVQSDSKVFYGTSATNLTNSVFGDCSGGSSLMTHCVYLTGLLANTTYYYQAKSYDASGEGVSSVNSFYSGSSGGSNYPPSAPSGLTASVAANGVDVVLNWTDNSTNENEFKIYWKPQGGNWSYLTLTSYNQPSFTYYNHPTGTYEYHINACNTYGCSGDSNTATVAVSAPATIPTAPSNLRAEPPPGVAAIYLTWNDNSSNEDKFNVEREVSGSGTWTLLFQQSANGTTYADAAVLSATSYNYRVQACLSGSGCSSYAYLNNVSTSVSTSTTTTNSPPTDVGIPYGSTSVSLGVTYEYGTSATDPNGDQIKFIFDWGDGQTAESGFMPSGYGYQGSHAWASVGTYSVRVKAKDALGAESSWTSPITVTVGGTTVGLPTAPSGLLATVISSSQVNLSWTDSSTNESGFKIYRNLSSVPDWTLVGSVGANITNFSDTGVSAGMNYNYRVNSYNASGNSPDSNWVSVTTSSGGTTSTTTGTTSTTTVDISPPHVAGFGNFTGTDGSIGAGVGFSELMNQSTINDSNVYIILSSDGSKVPGIATYYPDSKGVDFRTSSPALSGVDYQLVVKKNVKDLAGNLMSADYVSIKFQKGSVAAPTTVATFAVDPYSTSPKDGESSISTNVKVTVSLTKEYDSASTVQQFFSLAHSSNPTASISGSFSMFSTGFDFIPSAPLQSGASYIYKVFTSLKDKSGNPLSQEFKSTFTTASGVTMLDSVLEAKVVDILGNPVAKAYVSVYRDDYSFWRSGETDSAGLISASVPPGNYTIEVYPPSTRTDLVRSAPLKVSVSGGEKKSATFTLGANVKTLTGIVAFSDGKSVTDAEVGAYSSATSQWTSSFTDSGGKYTLKIGGGKWTIGVRPKDPVTAKWSWSGPFQEISFSPDPVSESKTADFIVATANSTLNVTTVDELGSPVANVGVMADTISSTQQTGVYDTRLPPEFKKSDSSGRTSFILTGRTYYLRGFIDPGLGFFNSSEQEVNLPSNEIKNVRLVFKRKSSVSTMILNGGTRLDSGEKTSAFVWAWSENGGYAETRSDSSGAFSINLSSGAKWHIGAGREVNGIPYKSAEVVVDAGTVSLTLDLVLVKIQEAPLPSAVNVTQSATQSVVLQVEDGAKMVLPASSAASGGTVNVEIKPTIEAPSQAAAQVVSTVYDVTVQDAEGKDITKFSQDAEITLPYDEEKLKAKGVTEDGIVPSFFDETTKTWVKIDEYTIDKEKNIVVVRVNHLTRFALVAAADITPPPAPSGVLAKAPGGGVVKILWTNPAKDFDHAKVYASEKSGILGQVVAAEVSGKEFSDNKVKDGIIYYYTVRAVDPAGNESTNVGQVAVKAVGTYIKPLVAVVSDKKLPSPGQATKLNILRDLTVGSDGEDVKTLQQMLLNEGVYPQGLITGFFGELTKQAVIRFQEKYADEILKPAGLLNGTGFVGPGTRKKLNSLFGVPIKEKPTLSPGQAVKSEILRDLVIGLEGDDIKSLQKLLLDEGVYPQGLITGFFGELTKQAVIRFQEKYASEILAPVGLDAGTGYVGPATRVKINGLLK